MKWSAFVQLACFTVLGQCTKVSDEVQAGYHVIYSYPGLEPPAKLLDLIKQGKVGGVLLSPSNIDHNVVDVVKTFQDTYAKSPAYAGVPLLIVTNQEGGQNNQVPGGPSLTAKDIGNSKHPWFTASKAGKEAADAMKAAHANTNLAPVLDVYREEGDFLDQAERSFSDDASTVLECVTPWIYAQQAGGVIATAKHYPGLGMAAANESTDYDPVTINAPLHTLRSVDEVPYFGAILAGVDMVMPSWAIYPSMDSKPAGMSRAWLQNELRGRLGFRGVIVSESIEAGALESFGDYSKRAILATQAGADLILSAWMVVENGENVVDGLVAALKDGSVSRRDFEAASERILNLRKKVQA
ncbi:Glycosyl hydrolase [Aspergillus sclerotialis]|uniref:Glycosyl hydrolase n=1 Tax=Aspergillus sclerotialis TaxID=2070753 RepID=A0A3A2ZQD5_9EURO|nr:Glycosyl hydrolase [Aspergillus sclerotialis]